LITLRSYQSRYFFVVFLLACAVTAGIIFCVPPLFQSSALLGIFVLLILVVPAVVAIYWWADRSSDRIAASVSRITVTSRAICEGAVDMRITPSEKADFAETLRAYTAVNKLADKSNKDIPFFLFRDSSKRFSMEHSTMRRSAGSLWKKLIPTPSVSTLF
jgi:hypothetical protein